MTEQKRRRTRGDGGSAGYAPDVGDGDGCSTEDVVTMLEEMRDKDASLLRMLASGELPCPQEKRIAAVFEDVSTAREEVNAAKDEVSAAKDEVKEAKDEVKEATKVVREVGTQMAVTEQRVSTLEKQWARVGVVGVTVTLFILGIVVSSVVAFFTLRADVRVLSRDVEIIAARSKQDHSTSEEIAKHLAPHLQKRVQGLNPKVASRGVTVRELCVRATTKEKRVLLEAFGAGAEGCGE